MADTKIAWADKVWNPTTGCTEVSPGCAHCYARTLSRRLQAMGQAHYVNGFDVALHPDSLHLPLTWKKPKRIFVNSMSDLFHKAIPDEFIQRVFDVMLKADWHTYLILTKRATRMLEFMTEHGEYVQDNIWLGVSVENQHFANTRIPALLATPAAVRFLSCEPLLGPLNLTGFGSPTWGKIPLSHWLHWTIVGGESGPHARPMDITWARDLKAQC